MKRKFFIVYLNKMYDVWASDAYIWAKQNGFKEEELDHNNVLSKLYKILIGEPVQRDEDGLLSEFLVCENKSTTIYIHLFQPYNLRQGEIENPVQVKIVVRKVLFPWDPNCKISTKLLFSGRMVSEQELMFLIKNHEKIGEYGKD